MAAAFQRCCGRLSDGGRFVVVFAFPAPTQVGLAALRRAAAARWGREEVYARGGPGWRRKNAVYSSYPLFLARMLRKPGPWRYKNRYETHIRRTGLA
jgi:hypothetical protein